MTRRSRLGARPGVAAVAGALCLAFSGILVRLADVSPSTAAFYRCAYALPPLLALAWWERRRYGPRPLGQRALAWVAGAFFAADLVLWHHAIGAVGAGLSTVLVNTQLVLVGLVAWVLLDERPERRLVAAVPFVLVGAVLISGVVGADTYGDEPGLGVLLSLLTAVAYSGFLLVLRAGNADIRRPGGALFDATLVAAAGSLLAGAGLGELELAPSWPAHAWLVVLALSAQVLAWLLISVSLPRLPAALTSLLQTLQPVATVLLAVVLVDEHPSLAQALGVVVVVAAVALGTGRRGRPATA